MNDPLQVSRVALARLRAQGFAMPVTGIDAAAARAGRIVVSASVGGNEAQTLGWLPGFEPVAQTESASRATPLTVHVLAACLGACWQDRAVHPWPGRVAGEDEIVAALDAARGMNSDAAALGRIRSALTTLRESLWLDPESRAIRLGPRVAAWSDSQVDVIREVYRRLPRDPRRIEDDQ
ncbi:hypothetical protein ABH926_003221 [Catenulispora sp. GP43]|uniref:hypothetical protein n=1 Tax=Catenulispora sp. GP43 TaxID=3156263 RepID=UPI0035161647